MRQGCCMGEGVEFVRFPRMRTARDLLGSELFCPTTPLRESELLRLLRLPAPRGVLVRTPFPLQATFRPRRFRGWRRRAGRSGCGTTGCARCGRLRV